MRTLKRRVCIGLTAALFLTVVAAQAVQAQQKTAEDARTRRMLARTAARRNALLETDPRLKQRFSLRMRYATMADALHALAPRANFDFAAYYHDRGAIVPERKSFAFVNLPLAAMLDRLAALYGITTVFHGQQTHTWGERASGVVVFHLGPQDPNFKPPPETHYRAPGVVEIKLPRPSDPPDPP